jgi:hypothetical protein
MVLKINGEERNFNENISKSDGIYNPIMKLWHIIFCIIYFFLMGSYWYKIIIMLSLPILNVFVIKIFSSIKQNIFKKNGDEEYIRTYYPEIATILENNEVWTKFINGEYIEYKKDFVLDDIRFRKKENKWLIKISIIIFLLLTIIYILSLMFFYSRF